MSTVLESSTTSGVLESSAATVLERTTLTATTAQPVIYIDVLFSTLNNVYFTWNSPEGINSFSIVDCSIDDGTLISSRVVSKNDKISNCSFNEPLVIQIKITTVQIDSSQSFAEIKYNLSKFIVKIYLELNFIVELNFKEHIHFDAVSNENLNQIINKFEIALDYFNVNPVENVLISSICDISTTLLQISNRNSSKESPLIVNSYLDLVDKILTQPFSILNSSQHLSNSSNKFVK